MRENREKGRGKRRERKERREKKGNEREGGRGVIMEGQVD